MVLESCSAVTIVFSIIGIFFIFGLLFWSLFKLVSVFERLDDLEDDVEKLKRKRK